MPDQLVQSYLELKNATLVAKRHNVSQSTVYRILKQKGVKREKTGGRPHDQYDAEIVSLFFDLKSTRLVADKLGLTLKQIYPALKRAGIETPRDGRRHNPYAACDINSEEILKMFRDGCSLAEMAKVVRTKGAEVKKFLERNGIHKTWPKATYGEKHYAWKGRLIDKDGYILIHQKNHPNARKHTHYILEHRLVMEEVLGRILLPDEVVHHIDKNKHNNHPSNLQLFASNGEHLAHELKGQCPNWSEEGLARTRRSSSRLGMRTRTPIPPASIDDAPQCI